MKFTYDVSKLSYPNCPVYNTWHQWRLYESKILYSDIQINTDNSKIRS